jgi:hypothetical protein
MLLHEARGDLFHLKVGDPVMVETHTQTVEATVIRRGREYITAQWVGSTRVDEFSMRTGRYRYEGNLRVFSMEQYAVNKRRGDVIAGLREVGIDLRINHELTLETQEKVLELIRKEQP